MCSLLVHMDKDFLAQTNASVLDLFLSFVKVEEPFNATAIQNMSLYLCDAYALLFLN